MRQSDLSRHERLAPGLLAKTHKDQAELRRLEQATPLYVYRLPDTALPRLLLHLLPREHVADQLKQAAAYLYAGQRAADEPKPWDRLATVSAYRLPGGRDMAAGRRSGGAGDGETLLANGGAALRLERQGLPHLVSPSPT